MKRPSGEKACTLGDVAEALGVSRCRAQQLEQRALKKCAAWLAASGLRAEDLLSEAALVAAVDDDPAVQSALSAPEPTMEDDPR